MVAVFIAPTFVLAYAPSPSPPFPILLHIPSLSRSLAPFPHIVQPACPKAKLKPEAANIDVKRKVNIPPVRISIPPVSPLALTLTLIPAPPHLNQTFFQNPRLSEQRDD